MHFQPHSEETKAKISSSHKGLVLTEETRLKISIASKNRKYTQEQNLAKSLSQIGRTLSPETKLKISKAHLGLKASDATKQKMSQSRLGKKRPAFSEERRRHAEQSLNCNCVACNHRFPQSPTSIEIILWDKLLAEFPRLEKQKRFGRFTVDAYLPEYHLAFEADGDYWHSFKKESDASRDAYLLSKFNLPVVRLTETELREINRA